MYQKATVESSSLIKDIGRSYIISSFLPAALFVSLGVFFLHFLLPTGAQQLADKADSFWGGWVIIMVFTTWLAFALYSSVDWIVKFYEGYYFQGWPAKVFVGLMSIWYRRKISAVRELVSLLEKESSTKASDRIRSIKPIALTELQPFELRYPFEEKYLLPTRLGNVLRASEMYPIERYQIDGITIWPRLFNILPRQFVNDLIDIAWQTRFK